MNRPLGALLKYIKRCNSGDANEYQLNDIVLQFFRIPKSHMGQSL